MRSTSSQVAPPCVDVSRLNSARRGANGPQSGLREEFRRIWNHLQDAVANPEGALCVGLMECTMMDEPDRAFYDSVFGQGVFSLGAEAFSAHSATPLVAKHSAYLAPGHSGPRRHRRRPACSSRRSTSAGG